jgi:hypothetical protein
MKMKGDRYSEMSEMAMFGFLANAMGGGGDRNQSFPQSDAEDFSRGARFIPGEVTLARRRGERVDFYANCTNKCCWYWQFKNGTRIYHWDSFDYESWGKEKCSICGNENVKGGTVTN